MAEQISNIDPNVFEHSLKVDPHKEKLVRKEKLEARAQRGRVLTQSGSFKEFRAYLQQKYTLAVQAMLSDEDATLDLRIEKIRANCYKEILMRFESIVQDGHKASESLQSIDD